jgi:hypothetical protein
MSEFSNNPPRTADDSGTPSTAQHHEPAPCDISLAAQLEGFLLSEHGWVSSDIICQRFGIADARALRRCGDRPGLCSLFAISGDKGFKHVAHATDGEWDRFAERIRQHGIGELVRVKALRDARLRLTRCVPPVVIEKATGQCLLSVT